MPKLLYSRQINTIFELYLLSDILVSDFWFNFSLIFYYF